MVREVNSWLEPQQHCLPKESRGTRAISFWIELVREVTERIVDVQECAFGVYVSVHQKLFS